MVFRKAAFLFVFGFLPSTFVLAQQNEISFSVGAIHSSDQQTTIVGVTCPVSVPNCNQFNTSTNLGVALEGAYTRQLFTFGQSSLDLEVPLVGVPGRDVSTKISAVPVTISVSTSSLFFTPSARVKFLHSSPVSPFVSFGGGLAHNSVNGNSTNSGALQFGGGLDFKTPFPHIAIRAEVRDFWARGLQQSSSFAQVSPERQHNVMGAGGVVFTF